MGLNFRVSINNDMIGYQEIYNLHMGGGWRRRGSREEGGWRRSGGGYDKSSMGWLQPVRPFSLEKASESYYGGPMLFINCSPDQFWEVCRKIVMTKMIYIFAIWWCKPFIFQTYIIWYNSIHSLKYLRYTTLCCKDIGIRKSEIGAKTQFL